MEGNGNQELLDYINNKYGKAFQYVSVVEGQMGHPYTMIQVRNEQYPEAKIIVRGYEDGTGKSIMQDNYVAFLLKERIWEEVSGIIKGVYGESKVFYKPPYSVLPCNYTAGMSIEEFLTGKGSMTHIYIYLPPEEDYERKEDKAKLLENMLGKKKYIIKGLICYLKDNKCYTSMSEDNYLFMNTMTGQVLGQGMFLMEGGGAFRYLRFR